MNTYSLLFIYRYTVYHKFHCFGDFKSQIPRRNSQPDPNKRQFLKSFCVLNVNVFFAFLVLLMKCECDKEFDVHCKMT